MVKASVGTSGTVLHVKSAHVLALVKETLQANKEPSAELSVLWGRWAGRLAADLLSFWTCISEAGFLLRLVFQKLTSSHF